MNSLTTVQGFSRKIVSNDMFRSLFLILLPALLRWILQDFLDQCPMPINAEQNSGIDPKYLWMPIIANNSDQCRSMPDRGISKTWVKLSIHYKWQQHCIAKGFNFHYKVWSGAATSGFLGAFVTNANECRWITINARSIILDPALIGIDWHWLALIGTDPFWLGLIYIDRHWALIEGVLISRIYYEWEFLCVFKVNSIPLFIPQGIRRGLPDILISTYMILPWIIFYTVTLHSALRYHWLIYNMDIKILQNIMTMLNSITVYLGI